MVNNIGVVRNRRVQHIFFWLFIVLFFTLLYGSFNDDYYRQFQIQLVFLPIKALSVYTLIYVLMPRYFFKKRYATFLSAAFISMLCSGALHWWVAFNVERPLFYNNESWGSFWNVSKIIKSATYIFPYMLIAFSIKYLKHSFKEEKRSREIIQRQMETELKFLKNQLNPHFLFNTLNNLYALTLKKSDLAPQLVLKLSSLMDYMLYESEGKRIALSKEVGFIEDFIEIERLRFGDHLTVDFQVTGETSGKSIAPLIFLPFIENAFKHGASSTLEHTTIHISVIANTQGLIFEIENSKGELVEQNTNSGIGLKNAKRRLALLYGDDNFKLTMEESDTYYKVRLELTDV
jgi:two-component system LytT family sensor kinase